MGTLSDDFVLDVDRKRVDLPEQHRGERISAACDARIIRSSCGESKCACRIGRVQYIERFATKIRAELERVPSANHSESVEKLSDRRREIGVRGRGRPDLL